jgi:hypothetical protein
MRFSVADGRSYPDFVLLLGRLEMEVLDALRAAAAASKHPPRLDDSSDLCGKTL